MRISTLCTIVLVFAASSVILQGCGGHRETISTSRAEATVEFTIKWPATRVIPTKTDKIKIWVSGPGISTPLLKEFQRPRDPKQRGSATLTVPAGAQRLFGAAAFDIDNKCIAFGNAIADLMPGEHKRLVIDMQAISTQINGTIKNPEDVGWQYQYGLQVVPDSDNPRQGVVLFTLRGSGIENLTEDKIIIKQLFRCINQTSLNQTSIEVETSPVNISGGDTRARKIDIAFVIDTTGSMGDEIAGVRDSVRNFASILRDLGHDIRLGAITFGDEIREWIDFTSDVEQFRQFVSGLYARGGGDTPEIGLDAVLAATALSWREDAEKFIIVITDATAHQRGDGTDFSDVTAEEVINNLRGKYIVHVVSPRTPGRGYLSQQNNNEGQPSILSGSRTRSEREPYDMKNLAPALAGIWIELPYSGYVDLTELRIVEIIRNTYRFTFLRALWFNSPNSATIEIYVKKDENTWVKFQLLAGTP